MGGETHVGFDDGHLALLHNQHGHQFDADEERIESVGAVEKRIMLQADAAAVFEEGLEVLIVVVQIVFAAEQRFDDLRVGGVAFLELLDVGKAAEADGDVT